MMPAYNCWPIQQGGRAYSRNQQSRCTWIGQLCKTSELGGYTVQDSPQLEADRDALQRQRGLRAARQANSQRSAAAHARMSAELLQQCNRWHASAAGREMDKQRHALPVTQFRSAFLAAVANNQVVVVSAETGSGKSTQLPNFILEEATASGQGSGVTIVVTQPRGISASSLAQRVAEERGEVLGDVVGYKVRTAGATSYRTRLTFVTSGLLLRRLLLDPELSEVTHVVLDEVHERHTNTDFLMILLKQLCVRRPDLKVVLMSATLDARALSDYFGGSACITMHYDDGSPSEVHQKTLSSEDL